jgi:hypothetical protein
MSEIGDSTSIHEMFEHGLWLVPFADHADGKLDDVLKNENAIVVMTASAAVFTNTLESWTLSTIEPVATTVDAAPPIAKLQNFSLNAPAFVQASPSSLK